MTPRACGLTLIELVVALVLASLMMVGLLRTVTVISVESNQLRGEQTDHVAAGLLIDRLRSDLVNARGIMVDRNSITLAGFVTGYNVPGVIRYEIVQREQTRVLLRATGDRRELCWVGCGNVFFQTQEVIDSETPVSALAGGLPPIPSEFQIGLMDDRGRTLFSEVIRHHAQ